MRPMTIPDGRMAGAMYFGGVPGGYEHRLWPAWFLRGPNASYKLGRPTSLGPQFGVGASWGRYDVSPTEQTRDLTFLHLLVPTDVVVDQPPAVRFDSRDGVAVIEIELIGVIARVELATGDDPAGKVTLRESAASAVLFAKSLDQTVQPNADIPGHTSLQP